MPIKPVASGRGVGVTQGWGLGRVEDHYALRRVHFSIV